MGEIVLDEYGATIIQVKPGAFEGIASGEGEIAIRGSLTPFGMYDDEPGWQNYTQPIRRGWIYVQLALRKKPN